MIAQLTALLLAAAPLVAGHSAMVRPMSRQVACTENWGSMRTKGDPANKNFVHANCPRGGWDGNQLAENEPQGYSHGWTSNQDPAAYPGLAGLEESRFNGLICTGLTAPIASHPNTRGPVYDYNNWPGSHTVPPANHYVNGGKTTFTGVVTASHGSVLHYYITKDGVDTSKPLSYADFEKIPNCTYPNHLRDGTFDVECTLPTRNTANHVILFVQEGNVVSGGTPELFTNCADIIVEGLPSGEGGEGDDGSSSDDGEDDSEDDSSSSSGDEGELPNPHQGEDGVWTTTITHSTHDVTHVTVTVTSTVDSETTVPPPQGGENADICRLADCSGCALYYKESGTVVAQCLPGFDYLEACTRYETGDDNYKYVWCGN